jgi:glycerol-3-phosphate acyltransferase PlsY
MSAPLYALMGYVIPLVASFVISFAFGSIPWGLIISKVFYKRDIRESGSGNIGTTNAMRTLGKVGGGAVFLLDFGKGVLSGIVGLLFCAYALSAGGAFVTGFDLTPLGQIQITALPSQAQSTNQIAQWFTTTAFLGCVLGHIFSPWLKFKGGKGIAVAVGCAYIAFGWWPTWILFGGFIVLTIVTRYVSIGSLAAAVGCIPVAIWLFFGNWYAVILASVVGLIIIWAHRDNIKRLITGTENRIGKK